MAHLGAIDIGTNSVRLLVTDHDGNELVRLMQVTRLGQGVDQTGKLDSAAVQRTLDVLTHYGAELRRAGVTRARVIATSAARDAVNRDEFLRAVTDCVGFQPELLSGELEAKLSFSGACASFPRSAAPFVVFDIGGGSTEFACGSETPVAWLSVDVGCVRVTERHLFSDPPLSAELAAAADDVEHSLELVEQRLAPNRSHTWLGLAGTVTSVAALAAKIDHYDPAATHGFRLHRDTIEGIYDELRVLNLAERQSRLLEPKRAAVIIGGCLILTQIVRHFGLDFVTASERDILDGLAASLRA